MRDEYGFLKGALFQFGTAAAMSKRKRTRQKKKQAQLATPEESPIGRRFANLR
jgi:hypothetical protein